MIYADHNFTTNFCNAVGTENDLVAQQIVIDELARLIVENKRQVVNLLRKNNVGVTINDPNNIIGNLIVKEISNRNQKIIKGISDLIAEERFSEIEFLNFINLFKSKEEREAAKQERQDKRDIRKEEENTIGDKLKRLFADDRFKEGASQLVALQLQKSYDKQVPTTTTKNQNVLDERLRISQIKEDTKKRKSKGTKIALIIGGSLLAVTLVTTIIIIRKRKRDA